MHLCCLLSGVGASRHFAFGAISEPMPDLYQECCILSFLPGHSHQNKNAFSDTEAKDPHQVSWTSFRAQVSFKKLVINCMFPKLR